MSSDDMKAQVDAYLAGDLATFREVDGWILATLRRHYARMGGEHEDVASIVHQKLLTILREGQFHGQSSLRTYVTRIVHHRAIDRIRQFRREQSLAESMPEESPHAGPDEGLERKDRLRLVQQALLALSQRCRELWRMVFVDKLSYDAIGEKLEIPPGTVKSRMFHCRRQASEYLEKAQTAPESTRDLNRGGPKAPVDETGRDR
ncbi:MAG: RNA polymerase sigma factor [bacterium]|nr:RNA polymerase sigma factor [bacterium]